MSRENIDEKANKKPSLRFSIPPYYLGLVQNGRPVVSLPGDTYKILEIGLAPSVAEVRVILLTMRRKLRWSREMLAAYMGVSRESLRRWEDGTRAPNGAARRLIWLLYELAFHPKQLKSAMDIIFWGRGEEYLEFSRQLAKTLRVKRSQAE